MAAFIIEKHGHLALLTLNSPHNRNLLTPQIANELAVAVAELADDMTVKALAITGAARAFCAGAVWASCYKPVRAMVRRCSKFMQHLQVLQKALY